MLILTRKIDQGIVISGNILVRVLGVERDRVKIGISAPLEVTVLRQELLERDGRGLPVEAEKRSRNKEAYGPAPSPITAGEEPPAKEI